MRSRTGVRAGSGRCRWKILRDYRRDASTPTDAVSGIARSPTSSWLAANPNKVNNKISY
jgi:hypothetical protein